MKKIGYGKIGRSMPLRIDKCGSLGGDVEMIPIVKELAERHPEDTFVLIGRNDGSVPREVGLPSNVVNPWTAWGPLIRNRRKETGLNKPNLTVEEHLKIQEMFDEITLPTILDLDAIILWAGQHGTTNAPIPSIADSSVLTKPHDWCAHYCAFLLRGVNLWRDVDPIAREEIWLNSDARNRLKMRDLKWPLQHPVLCQHDFSHPLKFHRYCDTSEPQFPVQYESRVEAGGIFVADVQNVYARLEINGLLPGTPFGNLISFNDHWEDRGKLGLFINETRKYVRADISRVRVMQEWVLPLNPTWVHGTWSKDSLVELGMDIQPAPWDHYYPRLHSVHSTFTTPASGTGWATAKPWEAFAAGTACFFHPNYDTQNNVLGDADPELRKFLRVDSPETLERRVNYLHTNKSAWQWVINTQRAHFDQAVAERRPIKMIEERLYGKTE